MPKHTSKPLERNLQAAVVRRLTQLHQADPTFTFRKRWGTPLGKGGDPDLYGLWRGRAFEIELKTPGEDPTLLQQARLGEWARAGALTGVVHSLAELEKFLDQLSPR